MSLNISALQTVTHQRKSTSNLLQYANNNRNRGRFNDVTIQSADISIPANRMVLSCYCSFFDKIFALETNNKVNELVVEIPNVDGKSLKLLIHYIYTGQMRIDSDNVFEILSGAHHLELDELKQFCLQFLKNCITLDNCINVLLLAKQHKNFTLREAACKHINDNFKTIIKTPAFLNLENDELFFIVYDLKTKFSVNDEVLCRSLLSWTKQDEETRKQYLQNRLFKFVDVDKLSYCFARDLLIESLICNISEYFNLLNARIGFLKSKGISILCIGGRYTETSVKLIFTLDDKTQIVYPDLPIPFRYSSALSVNNFVYCIGGNKIGSLILNKVFRLNLNETDMKWNEMAEMNDKRFDYGAALFNDTLVVCGGCDGKNYLSSSEVFDARLNKWNPISSLNNPRAGNQSATHNGSLYTMGGNIEGRISEQVERLDELDQPWEAVSFMNTPRNEFAAVSCNNIIYAIGGTSNGFNALKSVERFISKWSAFGEDKWTYVSEMNIGRRGHSACVMQGKIFVAGGSDDKNKPVREIECYDPSICRWLIVGEVDYVCEGHSIVAI